MGPFVSVLALDFFIAFGIVVGACMLGGVGAVLTFQPPTYVMLEIAKRIKIWAMVTAVGGTIDPLRVIETNFMEGHLSPAFKQILYFVSAFVGSHMATELVKWVCEGGMKH